MKKNRSSDDKKVPVLKGKSIVNLFMEPSTRTRSSFELAGKYLGLTLLIFLLVVLPWVKVKASVILANIILYGHRCYRNAS